MAELDLDLELEIAAAAAAAAKKNKLGGESEQFGPTIAAADALPPDVSHTGGITDRLTEGFLFGWGDEYLAGLSAVAGLQPDGAGGADWFQYDKPFSERYNTARTQILKERGHYAETAPSVEMPLPFTDKTLDVGVGGAAEVVGGIAGALLPIKYLNVLGSGYKTAELAGKTARLAGTGALGGGVAGAGKGEGTTGRITGAAAGAAVGGVAAPMMAAGLWGLGAGIKAGTGRIAKVLSRYGLGVDDIDPATGMMTSRGKKLLKKHGIDPESVSDDIAKYYVDAARAAARGASPDDIAKMADIESLGIHPTLGQATGDVVQQAEEIAMAAGARTPGPAKIMGEAFDTQKAQIDLAAEGLSREVVGTSKPFTTQEAADVIIEAVPSRAAEAKAAGRAAYKSVEESGAAFSGKAFDGFADKVKMNLGPDARIGPHTPNAENALDSIAQRFGKSAPARVGVSDAERFLDVPALVSHPATRKLQAQLPEDEVAGMTVGRLKQLLPEGALDDVLGSVPPVSKGSVGFMDVEGARQTLNTYWKAANRSDSAADQMAMNSVLKAFDSSVDDMFNRALISGDASALDTAKKARELWAIYKNTFASKSGVDRKISLLAEADDVTPNEVVNWVFGAGKNIGSGASARAMGRIKNILGASSEEFSLIKQAAFNKIMDSPQPKLTDKAAAISRQIDEFLTGTGAGMSRKLFTESERSAMAAFSRKVSRLVINPDAINRSGTGYENARYVAQLSDALFASLGFKFGGVGGAVAGREASKAARGFNASFAAKVAAAGIQRDSLKYVPVYVGGKLAAKTSGGAAGGAVSELSDADLAAQIQRLQQ